MLKLIKLLVIMILMLLRWLVVVSFENGRWNGGGDKIDV